MAHRPLLFLAVMVGATACECTPRVNRPPEVRILSPVEGSTLRGQGPFSLLGQASDADEVLSNDQLTWSSDLQGALGVGSSLTTPLNAGTHRLTFQAVDRQGAAATAQVTVKVVRDSTANTPPTVVIDAPTSGTLFDEGRAIALNGHADDVEDGALTGAALVWTSDKAGLIGSGGQVQFANAALGVHHVVLTATDHGALSAVTTVTIEVVRAGTNRPPVVTIQEPADGAQVLVGSQLSLKGSASDLEDGALTGVALVWSSSRDGTLGTGSPLAHTLSQGVHTLTLTATDSMGATGAASITVSVNTPNNRPPTVTITAPANNTTLFGGTSLTFTGSGSDPEDGTLSGLSLAWTSNRDGALGTGASLTTTTLTTGDHTITLVGTDSGGNTGTSSIAVHVLAPNQPPSVTITAPANNTQVTAGTSVTFSALANDPEDGTLSGSAVRWTSSLDGTLGSGTSFTTSGLTSGTHTISVTATDSGGRSASASISLTVTGTVTNQPPVARLTGPAQGDATTPLTFDGSGSSDPDGSITAYRFEFSDSTPAATGSATVTHAFATTGTFTVTLTVTDDHGATASANLTVVISPHTRVPEVVDVTDENASSACSLAARGTTLHVAWFSARHPTLWYATWSNGTLSREVIDTLGFETGGVVRGVLQLVLDATGAPHVIYVRDGQLWYATKTNGQWSRERVDVAPNTAFQLDTLWPSLAVNSTNQPTVVYPSLSGSNRAVTVASLGNGSWTRSVPTFPLGSVNSAQLMGDVTFNSTGVLLMPMIINGSTTSGSASFLATWNGSTSEVFPLAGTLGLTPATSLAWGSTTRLFVLPGTGLVDVSVTSPLASSTARVSYLETSGTQQQAMAVTASGEPRLVINHGTGLESVWPAGTPGFWQRFELGPTDPGRIDAAVDSDGQTRACFFRAGKLVLY